MLLRHKKSRRKGIIKEIHCSVGFRVSEQPNTLGRQQKKNHSLKS